MSKLKPQSDAIFVFHSPFDTRVILHFQASTSDKTYSGICCLQCFAVNHERERISDRYRYDMAARKCSVTLVGRRVEREKFCERKIRRENRLDSAVVWKCKHRERFAKKEKQKKRKWKIFSLGIFFICSSSATRLTQCSADAACVHKSGSLVARIFIVVEAKKIFLQLRGTEFLFNFYRKILVTRNFLLIEIVQPPEARKVLSIPCEA